MDWGRPLTSVETEQAAGSAVLSDPRDASLAAEVAESVMIVLIERRPLLRECFVRCFTASGYPVVALPSVESWIEIAGATPAGVVLLCTESGPKDPEVQRQIALLAQAGRWPVVLLADQEDLGSVMDALELGVRGYIPTSVPFEIAIEAIRLVKVGGTFVPASSLLRSRQLAETPAADEPPSSEMFTARQAAVVEALRRGKANKIIAHELNMRESTVKVHVRNIMKKLKAKNRTEVAFMTNGGAFAMRPQRESRR
jgi:DNA-binding NarL/FixJ family response regulator